MPRDDQGQGSGQGDGVTHPETSMMGRKLLPSLGLKGQGQTCEKGIMEMALLEGAGICKGRCHCQAGGPGAGRAGQTEDLPRPILFHLPIRSAGASHWLNAGKRRAGAAERRGGAWRVP